MLAEQAEREAAAATDVEVRDDNELPGVGDEPMSFREGLAAGGVGVIAVLGALDAFDALRDANAGLVRNPNEALLLQALFLRLHAD